MQILNAHINQKDSGLCVIAEHTASTGPPKVPLGRCLSKLRSASHLVMSGRPKIAHYEAERREGLSHYGGQARSFRIINRNLHPAAEWSNWQARYWDSI